MGSDSYDSFYGQWVRLHCALRPFFHLLRVPNGQERMQRRAGTHADTGSKESNRYCLEPAESEWTTVSNNTTPPVERAECSTPGARTSMSPVRSAYS